MELSTLLSLYLPLVCMMLAAFVRLERNRVFRQFGPPMAGSVGDLTNSAGLISVIFSHIIVRLLFGPKDPTGRRISGRCSLRQRPLTRAQRRIVFAIKHQRWTRSHFRLRNGARRETLLLAPRGSPVSPAESNFTPPTYSGSTTGQIGKAAPCHVKLTVKASL